MPGDKFYSSLEWKALRKAALKRDRGRCTAPGCIAKATHVDHIVSRRNGGLDIMENVRSLCRAHDNMVKESAAGVRARGGVFKGCDVLGMPLDPRHPWHADHVRCGVRDVPGGTSIKSANRAARPLRANARSKFRGRG
jgi:hypothetical protein